MLPSNTPGPAPAPQPAPAPLPFEPLRPQGSFAPDPAAQGFDQFAAGQPQQQNVQGQPPQGQPDLVDQLIATMRQQGVMPMQQPAIPQPGYRPQMPQQMPQQQPYLPNIDQSLLNEQVVAEKLRNLEITYSNAYQQTQDPTTKQSILLAYHGERASLEAQVRNAQITMQQAQMEQSRAEQNRMLEPVFRVLAAQILARELGIQDVNRVLNNPQGQPIWNPDEMRINAMYLAGATTQQNIAQQASRVIAPIPTGQQATPDMGNFIRTASREDFMRAVDQAKRTGIRVSMSG